MPIDLQFFKDLYAFCDEGKVELRALPSRKRIFVELNNLSEIDDFCKENDNYYFGVGLRSDGGTKKDITEIPAVFVDADFKDTPKELVWAKLKSFPFQPSFIIKSGHGAHFYWLLKEPAKQADIPQIEDVNKRIATYLGADLNATDASRILRIPGTLNVKHEPFVPCELVKKESFFYELENFLEVLPEVSLPKPSETQKEKNEWLFNAMNGVEDGQRNSTATKIAGYWINKVSPADTLTILSTWNKTNNPPLPDKDLQIIVKSVSRYEPEKTQNQINIDNIYGPERMVEEYEKYIRLLKNNKFITGIPEIDKRIRGVAGGEVLTIIARAGSFKTAMLQNLLKNYIANSAWGAAFFSLEMPIASVTERYFGILDGCGGREVEEMFKSQNRTVRCAAIDAFKHDLKNLRVIPTKISLNDIPKYIEIIKSEQSLKIGLIGIDYMGLIETHGTSEYEKISSVAKNVKIIAKMINLPIVLLCQVNRQGGAGQTEITLDMGRGSGAIEEGADFVLGLWQIGKDEDRQLVCKILKNRKGAPGSQWLLSMNPKTLQLQPEAVEYETKSSNNPGV